MPEENTTSPVHAQWLGWARWAKGFRTWTNVATALNVCPHTMSMWAAGTRTPSDWRKVAALCGATAAQYWAGPRMDVEAVAKVIG